MEEAIAQVEEPKVATAVSSEADLTIPAGSPGGETNQGVKPGGDDGQAVRARKEYERRINAEHEAQTYREMLASVRGELKALQEARAGIQDPKPLTIAEIDRAVAEGRATSTEAANYLAEQRAKEFYEKKEQERQLREAQARPVEEATKEVNEYVKMLPGLNDKSDPRWPELQDAALDIQGKLGIPQGPVLAMLALRQVYGSVNKLKKGDVVRETTRNVQAANQPGASAAGNSNTIPAGDKSELLTKVPKALQDSWNKYNLDPKDRITEAELYFKTQARLSK